MVDKDTNPKEMGNDLQSKKKTSLKLSGEFDYRGCYKSVGNIPHHPHHTDESFNTVRYGRVYYLCRGLPKKGEEYWDIKRYECQTFDYFYVDIYNVKTFPKLYASKIGAEIILTTEEKQEEEQEEVLELTYELPKFEGTVDQAMKLLIKSDRIKLNNALIKYLS